MGTAPQRELCAASPARCGVAASPTAAASRSLTHWFFLADWGWEGRNFKAGRRPPITSGCVQRGEEDRAEGAWPASRSHHRAGEAAMLLENVCQ